MDGPGGSSPTEDQKHENARDKSAGEGGPVLVPEDESAINPVGGNNGPRATLSNVHVV